MPASLVLLELGSIHIDKKRVGRDIIYLELLSVDLFHPLDLSEHHQIPITSIMSLPFMHDNYTPFPLSYERDY